MKYEVIIARIAERTFRELNARWRSSLKKAMRRHLERAPTQETKSRIKRLKGLRRPQYRLRVDEMRVFYDVDVSRNRVEVLGFAMKPEAGQWLEEHEGPE